MTTIPYIVFARELVDIRERLEDILLDMEVVL